MTEPMIHTKNGTTSINRGKLKCDTRSKKEWNILESVYETKEHPGVLICLVLTVHIVYVVFKVTKGTVYEERVTKICVENGCIMLR